MVVKMNNKNENFYFYMGKMFGSRIVQRQTNDRIYDDNDKEWYLNIEDDRVVAFVSVAKDVIKNVYSIRDNYLMEIFKELKKDVKIKDSIVSNLYKDVYIKSGFSINNMNTLKNFIMIYEE